MTGVELDQPETTAACGRTSRDYLTLAATVAHSSTICLHRSNRIQPMPRTYIPQSHKRCRWMIFDGSVTADLAGHSGLQPLRSFSHQRPPTCGLRTPPFPCEQGVWHLTHPTVADFAFLSRAGFEPTPTAWKAVALPTELFRNPQGRAATVAPSPFGTRNTDTPHTFHGATRYSAILQDHVGSSPPRPLGMPDALGREASNLPTIRWPSALDRFACRVRGANHAWTQPAFASSRIPSALADPTLSSGLSPISRWKPPLGSARTCLGYLRCRRRGAYGIPSLSPGYPDI